MFSGGPSAGSAPGRSRAKSPQGRITLPQMFKEHAGIENGTDAVVVGIEIGVELWSLERWEAEQRKIMEHSMKKDELEMMRDLETDRNEL